MAYKVINGKLVKSTKLTHTKPKFQIGGITSVMLPGGLQAYRTAVVNVAVIPRGSEAPVDAWMTDYGCSYMTKVMSDTPRAKELLINAYAHGDENGDMLQIAATVWDDENDCATDTYNVQELVTEAVNSLPLEYKQMFGNIHLSVEHGTRADKIGFVGEYAKEAV